MSLSPTADAQFHDIPSLKAQQAEDAGFRRFVGDGTAVLRVPGLRDLQAIRIGHAEYPMTLVEPTLNSLVENAPLEDVEHTMVKLQRDDQGAYLVRSKKSNDGLWQEGQEVFVKGAFEDAAENEPITPARRGRPDLPKAA